MPTSVPLLVPSMPQEHPPPQAFVWSRARPSIRALYWAVRSARGLVWGAHPDGPPHGDSNVDAYRSPLVMPPLTVTMRIMNLAS